MSLALQHPASVDLYQQTALSSSASLPQRKKSTPYPRTYQGHCWMLLNLFIRDCPRPGALCRLSSSCPLPIHSQSNCGSPEQGNLPRCVSPFSHPSRSTGCKITSVSSVVGVSKKVTSSLRLEAWPLFVTSPCPLVPSMVLLRTRSSKNSRVS